MAWHAWRKKNGSINVNIAAWRIANSGSAAPSAAINGGIREENIMAMAQSKAARQQQHQSKQ